MTDYWLSDLTWVAHLVGIIGMALIVTSMLYSLRKRKWLIRQGKMSRWMSWHHWAGFVGGVMALVHTLGNMTGLGFLLTALMLLVLGSSGLFFLERRAREPLSEATARLAEARGRRKELDSRYRDLYSSGRSGTPDGVATYNDLMAAHGKVQELEREVASLKEVRNPWTWWRHLHNVGTMMMVGVLLVHIWSKVYFGGGGLV